MEKLFNKIKDKEIREGVKAAIEQNLLPSRQNRAYKGHFSIVADASAFGSENTWPGLDSWQMAGAYLLMGDAEPALGFFDFAKASQRKDGHIPFAVFKAEEVSNPLDRQTYVRGLNYPDDIFEYAPGGGYKTQKWIGLFRHWVTEDPLSTLAPVCYALTAAEIYGHTKDKKWLIDNLPSADRACRYLLAKKSPAGLIGGAGFYMEMPPRKEWDGVTQCYCYKAFSELRNLYSALNDAAGAFFWGTEADALKAAFENEFWNGAHYAEYIHPEHGAVDFHGFTDIDFAAIAFGLADESRCRAVWELLTKEPVFWWGDMPTQLVTKPYAYRDWELARPVGFRSDRAFLYDVSAMGRVWYLEMLAALRMKDYGRIKEAVKLVCRRGLADGGFWYERYYLMQDNTVFPGGPKKYCEYPAVLLRTVLGNLNIFTK